MSGPAGVSNLFAPGQLGVAAEVLALVLAACAWLRLEPARRSFRLVPVLDKPG